MKLVFNTESTIWKFMGLIGDLICLNLLFLLTSLPVVTIGASSTAMYTVLFKMKDNKESYLLKEYMTAFIKNIKNSTIVWMLFLIFASACLMNVNLMINLGLTNKKIPFMIIGMMLFFLGITTLYFFAIQAKFANNLAETIVKSFIVSIIRFPYTIIMLIVMGISIGTSLINVTYILYAAMFWFLIGFASIGYINSRLFLLAFRKITPIAEENATI